MYDTTTIIAEIANERFSPDEQSIAEEYALKPDHMISLCQYCGWFYSVSQTLRDAADESTEFRTFLLDMPEYALHTCSKCQSIVNRLVDVP